MNKKPLTHKEMSSKGGKASAAKRDMNEWQARMQEGKRKKKLSTTEKE